MDLSKLSTDDLVALRDKNFKSMSTEGLQYLADQNKPKEPEVEPDTGFTGAMKSSAKQLQADWERLKGRTGVKDVKLAEQEAQKLEEEGNKVFKPTTESWTEAPWQKLKETAGGSVPYMAVPLAAGLAASALPLTGTAATVAGLGAAGAASAGQFTGSNLSRQQQEDPNLQLQDTNLMAAAAAAIPQAALDVVGFKYIPGIQKIFKSIGQPITEEAARKLLQQGTLRTAGQYIAGGAKISGIEGATEAGQQFFERLQAGLNITDENARKEYLDNFIGGAALGAVASPFGVRGQRTEARGVIDKADQDYATAEQARLDQEAADQAAAQANQVTPPVDENAEQERLLKMRYDMDNQRGILERQLDTLRTQAQSETDLGKLSELSEQAKAIQADIDTHDPDKIKSQMSALKKENTSLTKDLKEATKAEDEQAIQDITAKIQQNDATAGDLNDKLKAFSIKQQVSRAPEELDNKIKKAHVALQKAKDEGDLTAIGRIAQNIKGFEEEKAKFPNAHVQDYAQRMEQYKKDREQRTQDTLYQETEADKAEREIAESKGEPVKQQPYKEEMTSEDYQDRLAQNLVDLFTKQEKPVPTKLTPEQRKVEAERVAKIDTYNKKFQEAVAYYEKLIAEAEAKAEAGTEGKGARLYGKRGELLYKGEELQGALDAMMKAKGDLISAIPEGEKTPVESIKGLAAAQDINLLDLTDTIDSMRKGEFFGGPNTSAASGFWGKLVTKARQELDQYIQATVSSIDFARQAKGLAPLTDTEKTSIVDQIDTLMTGKIQRATGKLARVLKAGEQSAPEDTAMRDAFTKAGFKFAPLETGEREIKTGFHRNEYKDVKKFVEGLKNQYTNKPVKEIGKLQRVTPEAASRYAVQNVLTKKRAEQKAKETKAEPKRTTKERVAKEQQEAAQKTGLGLPGVKQEFETTPKGEAALPHNYDAVQTPFNFARQYFKESIARRSLTMNKKQQEAFTKARDTYKEAKVKLEKAFKENNVDPDIAKIMRGMIEMKEGTPEYRTQENLILGREEQLQQRALGIKPALKKTEIKPAKETAEEAKLKEDLGYKVPEPSKEEKAVGRISEVQLAGVRNKLNKRLKEVRDRIYGLGIKAEEKTAKERADLAKEQTKLEGQIKDIDTVLGARRVGMIVGQAQEEKGSKRDKPTKTEKKMTKAGAFEHAGITPSVYEQVVKTVKEVEAEKSKVRPKQARIPQTAKTLISKLADVEYRIEKEKLSPTEKSVLVREAAALRKQVNEELNKKQKDLEALFKVEAKEANVDPAEYSAIMRDVEDGDFDPRIKLSDSRPGLSQEAVNQVIESVKLPKGLKIKVFAVLPEGMKQYIRAQGYNPDSIRGFVTANGQVVVVANTHSSIKDVKETIAHEVTGHMGVEAVLGEDGMRALTNKVIKQEGGVMELAQKLGVKEDAYGAYAAALKVGKTKEQAQAAAVSEMIAHVAEAHPTKSFLGKANEFIKALVGALRAGLRKMGLDLDINTSDIYKILRDARKNFKVAPGAHKTSTGTIQFSSKPSYNSKFADLGSDINSIVSGQKTMADKVKASVTGMKTPSDMLKPKGILSEAERLAWRTRYIDRFAPIEKIAGKLAEKFKDSLKGTQLMYYMRMHDQLMNWVAQIASGGTLDLVEKKRADGKTERIIESNGSANFRKVAEALKDADVGNAQAANTLFTFYLAAKRAERVGLKTLNFGPNVTEAKLKKVLDRINSDKKTKDAFDKAAKIYNEYNKGLINFAVKTGAMSKETAKVLLETEDYIPFYRVDKGTDNVFLETGGATPVRIGNLKDQPYLHELVGGDTAILDVFTSGLQNTKMLTDMALRNLATRNVAFSLKELGLLILKKDRNGKEFGSGIYPGTGTASDRTIRFKIDGEDHHAIVDTDTAGIPAELLVQGMEGVKTSIPNLVRMAGIPAKLLRSYITRNPAYAVRQIVRDSLSNAFTTGANSIPILDNLKQLGSMWGGKNTIENTLKQRGILGGQVIGGAPDAMQKAMLQIVGGKPGWEQAMAYLDHLAIMGDASSRVTSYNSFIKQGLSDMEATLATLEAMNFNKRGISPSMYLLNQMVPFLNAQIQGLDVLYKAFAGKMPFAQKLAIKQKILARGALMAGMTMAYAAMESDDDDYKNATPQQRIGNWFIHIPGIDEAVKVPIPFEVGGIFKMLPEMVYSTAFKDKKLEEAAKEIAAYSVEQFVPSVTPTALKPFIELPTNHSFFTGKPIESARLQQLDPGQRAYASTPEALKTLGEITNVSPVKMEYLLRNFTGSMPLALMSLANPILTKTGEAAEGRGPVSSTTPIVGAFFQPKDANGLIDKAYEEMSNVIEAKQSYNNLVESGREEAADAFLTKKADLIGMATQAGAFRQKMGDLTKQEREVHAMTGVSGKEKREMLDMIKQEKILLSKDLVSARE